MRVKLIDFILAVIGGSVMGWVSLGFPVYVKSSVMFGSIMMIGMLIFLQNENKGVKL